MTELSPAAQKILRAAADQVAPEDYSSYTGHPEHDFAMEARNDSVREAILAIADELETLYYYVFLSIFWPFFITTSLIRKIIEP